MSRSVKAILFTACLLALTGCPNQPPPALKQTPPAPSPQVDAKPSPRPSGAKVVALFVPHEDLFWIDFRAFMQAAVSQLGMELRYYVADNSRELMKEQVRQATSGESRVDAVVFQSFKQNGGDLITIANEAGVPAFLVNADVDEAEWGGPRERFPHWLGTMVSDGARGGHLLATLLADAAKAQGLVDEEGKIHMIAIGGIVSDLGSVERLLGLEQALAERGDVVLHQIVPTNWMQEDGARKAAALLKRFPSTAVVWAASDPLALGAVESLKAAGRQPGVDCLVGGFDWTAEALEQIESGALYTSMGGEFMAGGWAAVLVHDFLEGRDFASKSLRFLTVNQPITKDDVARFHPAISKAEWHRVDFRALTAPDGDYVFDAVKTLEGLAAN